MSPFQIQPESGDIQPGQHDVTIVAAVPGVSNAGNEQLRVIYEDSAGAQAADFLANLPQVGWKWRQLWTAAGLPFPADGKVDEADLLGRRVHIDVYHDDRGPKVKEVSGAIGQDVPIDEPEPSPAASGFAAAAGLSSDDQESF